MSAIRALSIVQLYEDLKESLELSWIGSQAVERFIELRESGGYGSDVVGHLNFIHPERLQVVGSAEEEWARRISADRLYQQLNELLSSNPPAVIVADAIKIPPTVVTACAATETPLFSTPEPCSAVIDLLRLYLASRLANKASVHGVFMDVFGLGVLITGDSGIGKSELALELISRGHGLVADDVVELARIAPTTVEGRSPGMLRDYLEVRGLGLLNVRSIFGETAARRKMKLKLIVHLQKTAGNADTPRLPLDEQTEDVLGVPIYKVVIPVAAGRNLAVLMEAAARNTILKLRGINSMHEFITRQQITISLNRDE